MKHEKKKNKKCLEGEQIRHQAPRLFFCQGRRVSRVDEFLKVLNPPSNNVLIQGQLLPMPTKNDVS